MHPDRLDRLAEFPFRRLAALLDRREPARRRRRRSTWRWASRKHAPPAILAETVAANASSGTAIRR